MIFTEIFLFTLLSFITVVVINVIGKVFTPLFIKFNKDNLYSNFFIESILGLVIIITVYSCIYTRFLTISLGFIILLFMLFIVNKNYVNYSHELNLRLSSLNYRFYFYMLLLSFIVVLLNIIYPFSEGAGNDLLFYIKIAETLDKFGRENCFHEYNALISEFNGTAPYHYFELWLGSILFKFSNGYFSNAVIFKYGCYSVLKTLAILGLLVLIENFKKKITFLDVILVVLLSVFNLLYLTEFGGNTWMLYHDMWLRPTLTIYIIFLTLFFNSVIEKNYTNAILFALFLPIASTVTAPAVFSGITAFAIYLFVAGKTQRKNIFLLIGYIFIVAFFILLFYKITAVNSEILSTDDRSVVQMLSYSLSIIKAIIYFLFSLSLRTMIMLLFPCLFIILFLKNWKEIIMKNAILAVGAFLIALTGIITFQVFPFVDDTNQLPYVGYVACFIVVLILLYQLLLNAWLLSRSRVITFIFLSSFFVFNFIHIRKNLNFNLKAGSLAELDLKRRGLDENFIRDVKEYFSVSDERQGGFILDEKDIARLPRDFLVNQLGCYLAYLKSNLYLVSLTSPDVLYGDGFINSISYQNVYRFNRLTPFYRNYYSGNYTQYLKDYIQEHNIHFLMVSKNFKIKQLDNLSVKKVNTDNGTGSKFIILE